MMAISELFETLRFSERELYQYIKEVFKGDVVYLEDFYIAHIRSPELPWMVAHTDSHNKIEDRPILIDSSGTYIMSPEGIPADDRAGVFALITLKDKIETNFLFCSGEESGGIGALAFVEDFKKILKRSPYYIEIDRRGSLEAVCYHGEFDQLPEFKKAIIKTGFRPSIGTFSDISIITEETKVASVNLSAGFYHEHTCGEYLNLNDLEETIKRIPRLIESLGRRHYRIKQAKPKWGKWKSFYKDYKSFYYQDYSDGKWVWDDVYGYWKWLPEKPAGEDKEWLF